MEVDDRSMDMMMMMMPEFPENFPDPQFSMPINNIPPTYINNINPPPIISSPSSSNFLNTNYPIHQGMRARNNNNNCSMGAMREMIFRIAVMQPIQIDPEAIKAPKRRNVKISKDPQSVAARHRRERISERIRILQRLVPGGTKMDTASMLDEAIHYVKFLKKQVQTLHQAGANRALGFGLPTTATTTNVNYYSCSSIKDAGNYNYHHHPSSNMMV